MAITNQEIASLDTFSSIFSSASRRSNNSLNDGKHVTSKNGIGRICDKNSEAKGKEQIGKQLESQYKIFFYKFHKGLV